MTSFLKMSSEANFAKIIEDAIRNVLKERDEEKAVMRVPPMTAKCFGKALHAFMFAVRETIDEHGEKMKRELQELADEFSEDWRAAVVDLGFASDDE